MSSARPQEASDSAQRDPPLQPPLPDVVFSLDAEPSSLSLVVQTYLSILGWDDGGQGPPRQLEHTGVVTLERMERGIDILKEAKAAGRGFFYDSFAPTRNPAYPYLTENLYDLIFLVEERDPESHLPGELCRPYLVLCNLALESPVDVPPGEFPEMVACLYSLAHPIHLGSNLAWDKDPDDEDDEYDDHVWIGENNDLVWYSDSRIQEQVHKEVQSHLDGWKKLQEYRKWSQQLASSESFKLLMKGDPRGAVSSPGDSYVRGHRY